jgi:hypothetical protein
MRFETDALLETVPGAGKGSDAQVRQSSFAKGE